MKLGGILKQAMLSNSLSVKDLAKLVDVPEPNMYKYLNNSVNPDLKTMIKLCNALHIDLSNALQVSDDVQKTILDWLENKRESMDMTKKDFALYIGVPERTLINYYRFLSTPDLETLWRICHTLDTDINDLLGINTRTPKLDFLQYSDTSVLETMHRYMQLTPEHKRLIDKMMELMKESQVSNDSKKHTVKS